MGIKLLPPRRGRPQKFGRPSRAVTLTLPEDVIAALGRVDDDLSRAIVRVSKPLLGDVASRPPAYAYRTDLPPPQTPTAPSSAVEIWRR